MKLKVLLIGFLIVASTTSAMAAGSYISAGGGVSVTHDGDVTVNGFTGSATADYKTGYGFNLAGGYDYDSARIELEFGYKNADMKSISANGLSASLKNTELTVLSYMLNGYYDFKNQSVVTPFVGAGLGILRGELKDSGDKSSDTTFGYQLSAGTGIKVSPNVNLDLTYRFLGSASDFSNNGVNISYHSSNFLAGIRYTF